MSEHINGGHEDKGGHNAFMSKVAIRPDPPTPTNPPKRVEAADRIDELEAKLAKAVEALELANNNLTNLQPKIPQLVTPHWVPCLDGFIDPVIVKVRETLAAIKGETA